MTCSSTQSSSPTIEIIIFRNELMLTRLIIESGGTETLSGSLIYIQNKTLQKLNTIHVLYHGILILILIFYIRFQCCMHRGHPSVNIFRIHMSHFVHCNIVWGNCDLTLRNNLQKLQSDASRWFKLLGWKNLTSQQQIQKLSMIVYKSLHW